MHAILKRLLIALMVMALAGCGLAAEPTVADPPVIEPGPEPAPAPDPAPLPEPEPVVQTFTVTVVGDLLMHSPLFRTAWTGETYDFRPLFAPVADELSRADLTIANLETSLGGPERGFSGYPTFNTPDELLDALVDIGVDSLITANNHSLDSGVDGLKRGLRVIAERGLTAVGTQAEADDPRFALFELPAAGPDASDALPLRVALLAYTYGTNGIPVPEPHLVNLIDLDQMSLDLAAARATNPDLLLVAMHWGDEYARQPNAWQRELADFLHNEGVDAILGTHPHVAQPIELLDADSPRPVPVIYSTGNFVSNQDWQYSDSGLIVHLTWTRTISPGGHTSLTLDEVTYVPVWVHGYVRDGKPGYEVLPVFGSEIVVPVDGSGGSASLPADLSAASAARMSAVWGEMVELIGPAPVFVRPGEER